MRILIIDNDISISKLLEKHLIKEKYDVIKAANGEDSLEIIKNEVVNLVLLAVDLPEISGMDLLSEVKRLHPSLPVIMITEAGSVKLAVQSVKLGAYDLLSKPIDVDHLKISVRNALKNQNLQNEIQILKTKLTERFRFDDIVGNSKLIKHIFKLIERVANNDIPVLIQGASGTGKELIAKAIHDNGDRKNRKFIDVNCAAIPENLLESELFGHEQGSFTDAKSRHIGKFEQAENGTLFLDEIGEMPPTIQVKLLRILQEKTIVRVGGTEKIKINCRIITATNKNLKEEIKKGNFREDLYYRVSVFPINVPTLKERFDDILLLVPHFLKKYSANDHPKTVSPKAMKLLLNYSWPGNIRELENVIYRATILADGNEITLNDLPADLHYKRASDKDSSLKEILGSKVISYEKIEKEIYKHALRVDEGNITKAAKDLGIGRTTFYRKLRKHNLLKLF
jgi:two-component system, NtrC family, response regulator AtoC